MPRWSKYPFCVYVLRECDCEPVCFCHVTEQKSHVCFSLTKCFVQMNMVFFWPFLQLRQLRAHYLVVAGEVFTSPYWAYHPCLITCRFSPWWTDWPLSTLTFFISLSLSVFIVCIDVFLAMQGWWVHENAHKIIMHSPWCVCVCVCVYTLTWSSLLGQVIQYNVESDLICCVTCAGNQIAY